jgi:hypothetical protein
MGNVDGDGKLEPVDDRMDFVLRRGRVGFSGRVLDSLEFRAVLFFDNLGKDRYSGTRSTINEGTTGIWDAYCIWNAKPAWANVVIGYFRPQIGRENLTSGFQTNSSMDKLPTQIYSRYHTVGRSSGRELGINFGGLRKLSRLWLNYNLGVFDTSHALVTGSPTGGTRWSPLLVGRAALSIGDPEMTEYSIDYRVNYFNRRKGATAAVSYSHQGETDLFRKNQAVDLDLLINYRGLNFDAELDVMDRNPLHSHPYRDHVWHIRGGYNIRFRNTWLEPVVVHMQFTGDRNSPWADGRDTLNEVGLNWYVRETRVRLNVHRTWQNGSGVSNVSDGQRITRGDMIGFGVQLVY